MSSKRVTPYVNIGIRYDVYLELQAARHEGQSFSGIIAELLHSRPKRNKSGKFTSMKGGTSNGEVEQANSL